MRWELLAWLLALGGTANMVPPLAAKWWPKWKTPVDRGLSWGGQRLLGDHKTWRGLVVGSLSAEIIYLVTQKMGGGFPWWWGGLVGLGSLTGDMVKSFIKRRMGIKSGKSWFPWDQIDWIGGIVVVAGPWCQLNGAEIMVLLATGLGLHLIVKLTGKLVGINQTAI